MKFPMTSFINRRKTADQRVTRLLQRSAASASASFRGWRGEDGQSLAEFAMISPLLLLLVTGIFWFGIALNNDLVLTNAVTSGAQAVAVARGQSPQDPCAAAQLAVKDAAQGLTTGSLNFTLTINGTQISTYKGTGSWSCSSATMTAGQYATLSVTYPVTVNLFATASQQFTMSASTTEVIE